MTPGEAALTLASASPRRAELLSRLGLTFDVEAPEVDESLHTAEDAATYVDRIARAKAAAVSVRRPAGVVVAADTAVVLDGVPLGKPADDDHALDMLEQLAGRTHVVLTSVAVRGADGRLHTCTEQASVMMTQSVPAVLAWYVATGEPRDKAGAYGLQGRGAILVDRVDGDPTTVIGLPLRATARLMQDAGLRLFGSR